MRPGFGAEFEALHHPLQGALIQIRVGGNPGGRLRRLQDLLERLWIQVKSNLAEQLKESPVRVERKPAVARRLSEASFDRIRRQSKVESDVSIIPHVENFRDRERTD